MKVALWVFAGLGCMVAAPVSTARCYDLSKGEPATLTGTLDYVIYP